jgi:Flp pilus assembly protein TadD
LAVVVISVAGCHSSSPAAAAATATHYYYVDSDAQKASEKGEAFEDPSKVADSGGATKADLVKLTTTQQAAKKAMDNGPTPETKSKYVDVTVDLANKTMYCDELTPHEKYSGALKLFREALRVDPNNPQAKEAADTIVKIYKRMRMPVPE